MNVFDLRKDIIARYNTYVSSFFRIRDEKVKNKVDEAMQEGALWPEPLLQLNPSFAPGASLESLIREGVLHPAAADVFKINKDKPEKTPFTIQLHKHQEEAIRVAHAQRNYVLTTGTGSGKSLSYIIPIVDYVLRNPGKKGVKAIIIYPMNALANSQAEELKKFLQAGFPDGKGPVTFDRYTGQEKEETRKRIIANPPDILLTNYMMLELILTRTEERALIDAAKGLQFLVMDELHTYRGRQGADVSMLVRRVRDRLDAPNMRCIGTSATMSTAGTFKDQQADVAAVASKIFGATVEANDIIGETLRRITQEAEAPAAPELARRIREHQSISFTSPEQLAADSLAQWVESFFGIEREPQSGRFVRRIPKPLGGATGAAAELSWLTGETESVCETAIRAVLMAGNSIKLPSGYPMFAFRLHQFISRGDTAYSSLESPEERFVTLAGQKYVPDGTRERLLLPLCFCRECGQDFYSVFKKNSASDHVQSLEPRDLGEFINEGEESSPGFILFSDEILTVDEMHQRIPSDWLDGDNVKKDRRKYIPTPIHVQKDGKIGNGASNAFFMSAPFRFCPVCEVSYNFTQRSDFAKLATLSSEGRSTATTILSLATIDFLRSKATLDAEARKLLSFTDNRQDASLQAGHFNDFVQVTILRSVLYQALKAAGDQGITHDELTQAVFKQLNLPLYLYAVEPEVKYQALKDTEAALRDILGYRVYRDLERGWRITAPNLEQCGLLVIKYQSLEDLCATQSDWNDTHPALLSASPETRVKIAKTLLDFMRRSLAIKVDYLEPDSQERIRSRSNQKLIAPWNIDENERFQTATMMVLRSQKQGDNRYFQYLSTRGGMGRYLRRPEVFDHIDGKLKDQDIETILKDLCRTLRKAGLVEEIEVQNGANVETGYQVPASALLWTEGDGSQAFHDPIRVPQISRNGLATNSFFKELYSTFDTRLLDVAAREHTAQVKDQQREEREKDFRSAKLPILFCSPTMELGVDIASLNVVNMRNVPPTPANYAQRSGRAGRSGQPALVFSYCTTGSSHDQYFFKRPHLMVSGKVAPPRIELANEDLLRAHVHAVWLGESSQGLGRALSDITDLAGSSPSLELDPSLKAVLKDTGILERSRVRAARIIKSIEKELTNAYWYKEEWLDRTLSSLERSFEQSCERWRTLYRTAIEERDSQHKVANDHSRNQQEREKAKRLRDEAEAKIALLVDPANVVQSDFYSYRYFASEGFLPGYNFPRLPLSAFIPGRRMKKGQDNYLSRPRFLAISEFGPRAVVYHEGSKYEINRVMLRHDDGELATQSAKICAACGYAHTCPDGAGPDVCEMCKAELGAPYPNLFRLENVSTRRKENISSDEEERLRLGYDIRTAVRFASRDGVAERAASVKVNGKEIGTLLYGDAASIWRINLGWARRNVNEPNGFLLNPERGFWQSNKSAEEDAEEEDLGQRPVRVVPFVEDHKNCLIFKLNDDTLSALKEEDRLATVASLQAALKVAIQARYQLEDNELSIEALPDRDKRKALLLYESGEGGAGALRRLVDDSGEFAAVAQEALAICHFGSGGEDKRRSEGAKEDCDAACYSCLLNYGNQPDHLMLDRKKIAPILLELSKSKVDVSPRGATRSEHLEMLMRFSTSSLEKDWLTFVESKGFRLPSSAQKLVPECSTRPDFMYEEHFVAIYVDGPFHDYPDRAARDQAKRAGMEDAGFTVITFNLRDDWETVINRYPDIFGVGGK
jgi:superfamily II DNA/RNA helicase/very-short-patch-repair endonuclease